MIVDSPIEYRGSYLVLKRLLPKVIDQFPALLIPYLYFPVIGAGDEKGLGLDGSHMDNGLEVPSSSPNDLTFLFEFIDVRGDSDLVQDRLEVAGDNESFLISEEDKGLSVPDRGVDS